MHWRRALALLAVGSVVTACSATAGSGQLATQSPQVSGFASVELAGVGELSIDQTGTESLTVSAEDNLLPLLTSEVEGDTLILGKKPNTRIVTTKPITYTLTMKDITGLAVSGSGTINAPKLTTAALRIEISGSGMITTAGNTDDQNLEISGSGHYLADGLTSKTTTAEISGSGTANVVASDALDVKISGSGTLTYSGNPPLTQTVSGSGRLIKK
ncbi:MAG: head GIN domain-containing protein [Propionibacteriaceae bacterium]